MSERIGIGADGELVAAGVVGGGQGLGLGVGDGGIGGVEGQGQDERRIRVTSDESRKLRSFVRYRGVGVCLLEV